MVLSSPGRRWIFVDEHGARTSPAQRAEPGLKLVRVPREREKGRFVREVDFEVGFQLAHEGGLPHLARAEEQQAPGVPAKDRGKMPGVHAVIIQRIFTTCKPFGTGAHWPATLNINAPPRQESPRGVPSPAA